MPNFDKTGPNGEGPNTGGGKGNCNSKGNNFGGRRRCCDNNFGGRGYKNNFSSIDEKEKFLLDELEKIRKIKKD